MAQRKSKSIVGKSKSIVGQDEPNKLLLGRLEAFAQRRYPTGVSKTIVILKPKKPKPETPSQDNLTNTDQNGDKAGETERNAAPAKYWGIKRIIGWIFKKTSHIVYTVIVFVVTTVAGVILVDIFTDRGWLKMIKDVIYKILLHR